MHVEIAGLTAFKVYVITAVWRHQMILVIGVRDVSRVGDINKIAEASYYEL